MQRRDLDLNAQNSSQETPLFIAAKQREVEIVALLVAAGADFTLENNDFDTPADIAEPLQDEEIDEEASERLQKLLANPYTLFDAAQAGNRQQLSTFLNMGINPNAQNTQGATPLFLAALYGRIGVVQLLVEQEETDLNLCNPP